MTRSTAQEAIQDPRAKLMPRFLRLCEKLIWQATFTRVHPSFGAKYDPAVVKPLLVEAFATALREAGYLDPYHCFNCGTTERVRQRVASAGASSARPATAGIASPSC